MLVLAIRTDKPLAEISLIANGQQISQEKWQAHRLLSVTIHQKIEQLLKANGRNWESVEGVVFFAGPGSFTGLRIGGSVAGALASGLDVPIVSSKGKDWISSGTAGLANGQDEKTAIPFYGGEARVTKPKK